MIAKMMYMIYVGGGIDGSNTKGYASQCKNCNKCVKVCTQHIAIPAELKNVAKALEGPDMKVIGLVFRPVFNSYMRYDRWRRLEGPGYNPEHPMLFEKGITSAFEKRLNN